MNWQYLEEVVEYATKPVIPMRQRRALRQIQRAQAQQARQLGRHHERLANHWGAINNVDLGVDHALGVARRALAMAYEALDEIREKEL